MTGELIGARFPAPRREILDQIPQRLHKLFGDQTDPEPGEFSDEIDYVYEVKGPDGSPFEALLYCEYGLPGGLPVAFIVGDLIELDGVPVEVAAYRDKPFRRDAWGDEYRYWRVTVRMPHGVEHGRS